MELDDAVHAQILKYSAEGDRQLEDGRYAAAIQQYEAAWELLPQPRYSWEAALWLLASIGDAYWHGGQWEDAIQVCIRALLHCPDALGNPFLHLRLGEAYYELGAQKLAKDALTRTYLLGGREAFSQEDPKYFELLRDTLLPPEGKDDL